MKKKTTKKNGVEEKRGIKSRWIKKRKKRRRVRGRHTNKRHYTLDLCSSGESDHARHPVASGAGRGRGSPESPLLLPYPFTLPPLDDVRGRRQSEEVGGKEEEEEV